MTSSSNASSSREFRTCCISSGTSPCRQRAVTATFFLSLRPKVHLHCEPAPHGVPADPAPVAAAGRPEAAPGAAAGEEEKSLGKGKPCRARCCCSRGNNKSGSRATGTSSCCCSCSGGCCCCCWGGGCGCGGSMRPLWTSLRYICSSKQAAASPAVVFIDNTNAACRGPCACVPRRSFVAFSNKVVAIVVTCQNTPQMHLHCTRAPRIELLVIQRSGRVKQRTNALSPFLRARNAELVTNTALKRSMLMHLSLLASRPA